MNDLEPTFRSHASLQLKSTLRSRNSFWMPMVTKYGIYLQMWDAFNMEKPTAFVKKERLPYPKSSASFPVHRVWTYQDNAQIEPRTQLAMKMAGVSRVIPMSSATSRQWKQPRPRYLSMKMWEMQRHLWETLMDAHANPPLMLSGMLLGFDYLFLTFRNHK